MRALLFDLDNTLIDRDLALEKALTRQSNCSHTTRQLLELDDHGYGERSQFLAAWSDASGSTKTMRCLSKAICDELEPDQELLRALCRAKRRFTIGIISNGGVLNQQAKMQRAGLHQVFETSHVLISGGLSCAKPSAEIFRLGCRALQVPPAETLFIGDHPEVDVAGALRAGLLARLTTKVLDARYIEQLIAPLGEEPLHKDRLHAEPLRKEPLHADV